MEKGEDVRWFEFDFVQRLQKSLTRPPLLAVKSKHASRSRAPAGATRKI
jgi:hypothetical protein